MSLTVGYQFSRLLEIIEEVRSELNILGSRKPLTDPDVIKLSQKLDHLLNQYLRLQCSIRQ